MACYGQCYSNQPCVCYYNCTCNGQNITCTARRSQCPTRVIEWGFDVSHVDPLGKKDIIILASHVVKIRENLVQEQKDRSAHYTNKGGYWNEGYEYDSPLKFTDTWHGNEVVPGNIIMSITFLQLKKLCNELYILSGGIGEAVKATFLVGEYIKASDFLYLINCIGYSHSSCICNEKSNCHCRNYCACNSFCMNCPTNGCGYCSCNGACSCNCGPCGCNSHTPPSSCICVSYELYGASRDECPPFNNLCQSETGSCPAHCYCKTNGCSSQGGGQCVQCNCRTQNPPSCSSQTPWLPYPPGTPNCNTNYPCPGNTYH